MMTDDTISKKAAIDALGYCQTYLFDSFDKDKKISLEDAEYAIEQLPSAEPKWIPCSAKYPKENGYYLVTIRGYIDDRLEVAVEYYSPYNSKYLKKWKAINVIAWTVPKPYKGEQENER